MKCLQLMTKEVERPISKELPNMFAIILDGWTDAGTSTPYMGVYVHCEDHQSTEEGKSALLAYTASGRVRFRH